MSEWLLRWQYWPRHWQGLTAIAAPCLLLLVLACGWLQPLRARCLAQEQQHRQLQQQYQTRMAQLRRQPELSALQQQNQLLHASLQAPAQQAFTLVALMAHGAVMEMWQPAAQGGELRLLLSWPQFQHTLAWLASRQPAVVIETLSLQREGEQLRMALSLGFSDED